MNNYKWKVLYRYKRRFLKLNLFLNKENEIDSLWISIFMSIFSLRIEWSGKLLPEFIKKCELKLFKNNQHNEFYYFFTQYKILKLFQLFSNKSLLKIFKYIYLK